MTIDRIATANVLNSLTLDKARQDLDTMLARNPDGLVLVEWAARDRWALLATRGRRRRAGRRRTKPRQGAGITWAKALTPTGIVIGMTGDRYTLLRVRAVKLTGRTRVAPTRRHPRPFKPANRVLVTVWRDHVLDEDVTVIGSHLLSGVQRGRTGYRHDPESAARVALHKRQRAALEAIIARHKAKGRTVYAAGDGNYHRLRLEGVTSAYVAQPEGLATLGNRGIDDVHGPGVAHQADDVELNSDHDGLDTRRTRARR